MADLFLLATDGSKASDVAVDYVRKFLDSKDDRILVLSVADESKMVPYLMGEESTMGGIDLNNIRDRIEERAHDAVQSAVQQLEKDGFSVEGREEFGDPGELICQVARENDVSSIILGRRGHSTVGELLLGSVSHYVVHHSERPVTLVPLGSDSDEEP